MDPSREVDANVSGDALKYLTDLFGAQDGASYTCSPVRAAAAAP